MASSVANDVIMRTGATSAVGAGRHNENDVTMTIVGLWRYGDWRRVATDCIALVHYKLTIFTKLLFFTGSAMRFNNIL